MIDYNATLQNFFAECIKFLKKRRSNAADTFIAARITQAIRVIQTIAENPRLYADYKSRIQAGFESDDVFNAFDPRFDLARTYVQVLYCMQNLNSPNDYERVRAQGALLSGMKKITYANSANVFKDFIYPFMAPKKFAVHVKQNSR